MGINRANIRPITISAEEKLLQSYILMGDLTLDLRAILTIVSILTAIGLALIFQWWRNRKSITYQILADTALLNAETDIRKKLQIFYEGRRVDDVQLLILRVRNEGRQPIDEKDFKKPLDFVFSNDAEILSSEITKVDPENLEVELSSNGNRLSISPVLLNHKDFFELRLILNANNSEPEPDARIIGIKKLKRVDRGSAYLPLIPYTIIGPILGVIAFLLGRHLFMESASTYATFEVIAIAIMIAIVLAIASVDIRNGLGRMKK